MLFSNRSAIRRLTGTSARFVLFIDYDEMGQTRNYCLALKPSRGNRGEPSLKGWVHIKMDTHADEWIVTVTVEAGFRKYEDIGSFTLPVQRYPSPVWLDPAAIRRALRDTILPTVSRYRAHDRRPDA